MGLYKVTLKYSVATVAMQNVLYFDTSLSAQELCDDLSDVAGNGKFIQKLANVQVNSLAYSSVAALQIGHLILDPDYFEKSITMAGAQSSALTDPQLAACVSLHTGLSGRHRRGRFFIGGVPDVSVEYGKLTASGQSTITSTLDAIKALYIDGSPATKLVVFSRSIFAGLTDIILDSYKPVTSMSVRTVMSTMRSRLPS